MSEEDIPDNPDNQYLNSVRISQSDIRLKSALVRLEQQQALKDLHSETYFDPADDSNGPYDIEIRLADEKMFIDVVNKHGTELRSIFFALKPYRKLIQDYFLIVESFEQARNEGNTSRLEAIDMGRRGLHNEGADMLKSRLSQRVEMNSSTARRLFTLICILCAGRRLLWF